MQEKTEIIGSHRIARDGPFKLEMSVQFVGVSGEHEGYTAHASLDLPPGELPTSEKIVELIGLAKQQLGDSFRLATRHEFVNELLIERTGQDMNFAIPGPNEFNLKGIA